MNTSRGNHFSRNRASLLALVIGAGLLTTACDPGDGAQPGAPAATGDEAKSGALQGTGVHGFMIVSQGHPDLAINAYGGAYDGGALKEYQGCWWENGACTWTYRNGALYSDYDQTIGISAPANATDGTLLVQSASCSRTVAGSIPSGCKWIYRDGRFISAKYPNLAIYASGKHGSDLKLDAGCVTSSSNNCHWIIQEAMIESMGSTAHLMYNAWGGSYNGAPLRLADACTRDNPACTWTFINGMILSDWDHTTALNAWGGAAVGTQLAMSSWCDVSNPDCRWRLENGVLYSDTSNLAVNPEGQFNGANTFLQNGCSSTNCKVDTTVGGPQCGQVDQAPCDGTTCIPGLVLTGRTCQPVVSLTIPCGPLHASDVDATVLVGVSNDGAWGFKGHAHDGGLWGENYTLGFTFNNAVNGKKVGTVHSGVVHGTLDAGSRNSDFVMAGHDQSLIDNFGGVTSGGIKCNLKVTANPWLIGEDALIGLGLAAAGAVFVWVQGTGDCNWQATPDGQGLQRDCTKSF
jgi:hypothetical protein